jgi:hypothetical protein
VLGLLFVPGILVLLGALPIRNSPAGMRIISGSKGKGEPLLASRGCSVEDFAAPKALSSALGAGRHHNGSAGP